MIISSFSFFVLLVDYHLEDLKIEMKIINKNKSITPPTHEICPPILLFFPFFPLYCRLFINDDELTDIN